jgi:hypothetical protein
MTKKEILHSIAYVINNALEQYTCARNENQGLRDPKVEAKVRAAKEAIINQMKKL